MKNIKLKIAYDGAAYWGWAKNEGVRSVCREIEKALSILLKQELPLEAASRTDKGVHAEGQIACFLFEGPPFFLAALQKGLNGLLPHDIRILEIEEMDPAFHPTLSARGKRYHYDIFNGKYQLPHLRNYSWHIPQKLDPDKMAKAKEKLLGRHDFAAFTCDNTEKNTIREITEIDLVCPAADIVRIEISADRFLYKMVRVIAGTLAYIGLNKLDCEIIGHLLKTGERGQAGITAPAKGLFLEKVFY